MTFLGLHPLFVKTVIVLQLYSLYTSAPLKAAEKKILDCLKRCCVVFCCTADLLEVWGQRVAECFFGVLFNRKAGALRRPLCRRMCLWPCNHRRNGIGGNVHILSDLSRGGEEMKGSAIVPYIILPGGPEVGEVAGEPSYTGRFIAQAFSGILQRLRRKCRVP